MPKKEIKIIHGAILKMTDTSNQGSVLPNKEFLFILSKNSMQPINAIKHQTNNVFRYPFILSTSPVVYSPSPNLHSA